MQMLGMTRSIHNNEICYICVLKQSISITVPNQDNRNGRYGYQIMAAARSVRVETCCFLLIHQLTI